MDEPCENPDRIITEEERQRIADELGFNDDHRVGESYGGRGSVKRSHRAEGRNFID